MSSLVLNLFKGQRVDITAQMKDADAILEVFRQNNLHFAKKFTTISGEGPSTITFKGVRAENAQANLMDACAILHTKAKSNDIGNVYVRFISMKPKRMDDAPAAAKEEPAATEEPMTSEEFKGFMDIIQTDDPTL